MQRAYLFGGTGAINPGVATAIGAIVGPSDVDALGGHRPLRHFGGGRPGRDRTRVGRAGRSRASRPAPTIPDGLAGGVAAAVSGGPLLLTKPASCRRTCLRRSRRTRPSSTWSPSTAARARSRPASRPRSRRPSSRAAVEFVPTGRPGAARLPGSPRATATMGAMNTPDEPRDGESGATPKASMGTSRDGSAPRGLPRRRRRHRRGRPRRRGHPRRGPLHVPARGHRRHRRLRRAVQRRGASRTWRTRSSSRAPTASAPSSSSRSWPDRHDTVGIDLVAMCANDILVSGAEPLFFLDYVAVGKLDSARMERIVAGIAEGCRQAGCALVGGEMAEHPGTMDPDDYDLSGFCVGVVDRPEDDHGRGDRARRRGPGLASSGLHSNGFSLVRKVLVEGREDELVAAAPGPGRRDARRRRCSSRRASTCTRCARSSRTASRSRAWRTSPAAASPRTWTACCPADADAVVHRGSWHVPPVFDAVQPAAGLDDDAMYRTFNMGIGFALVIDPAARRRTPPRSCAARARRSSRSARSSPATDE